MSKLDELIAELCPDGVEYKPLSEIATITRGGNLQKKDFTENGVPCIHYGQIYTKYGLFTDKTFTFVSEATALRQKKAVTGDIVRAVTSENIEDVCKCVVWLGEEDVAVSFLFNYGTTIIPSCCHKSCGSQKCLHPIQVGIIALFNLIFAGQPLGQVERACHRFCCNFHFPLAPVHRTRYHNLCQMLLIG